MFHNHCLHIYLLNKEKKTIYRISYKFSMTYRLKHNQLYPCVIYEIHVQNLKEGGAGWGRGDVQKSFSIGNSLLGKWFDKR